MMYIISAINRLTGEREVISPPRSLELATELMEKFKASCRKHHQFWKNPRIEPCLPKEEKV